MKLNTKAAYEFIEFVRPDGYHKYSTEQQFGVFLWMCQTAYACKTGGDSGPIDLLSKKPTCLGHRSVEPIISLADLHSRFHYALLSMFASQDAKEWRRRNGIDVNGRRVIAFPHHVPFKGPKCDAEVQKQVSEMLAANGSIEAQLNQYHIQAKNIEAVVIHCGRRGFRFTLDYGYDGSVWHHDLAVTENGEPFTATLDKATTALAQLRTLEEAA